MNDGSALWLILTLAVLVSFSAFFSATETAYTSFSPVRLKTLAKTKKSARLAVRLSENYNKVLSTLLIGNNIVNISAASIATIIFTHYYGEIGVTLSTIVMTVVVLIFGEISPKTIAKEKPETFAMFSAWPLYVFTIIFTPLNFIFDGWKWLLNKIFRLDKKKPSLTEEEFQMMVTDIKNEGVLNEIEHEIIQNTIKYDEMVVESVMTDAENITAVCTDTDFDEIKEIFEKTNFSRIPVYGKTLDNIVGILYRADFYEMVIHNRTNLNAVLKVPLFTEKEEKISKLFKKMQKSKIHMAIVKDSQKTAGLITMEDIIEQLVGEIDDRYDPEQAV